MTDFKDWKGRPDRSTPLSAPALEDMEQRIAGMTPEGLNARVDAVESAQADLEAADAAEAVARAAAVAAEAALRSSGDTALDTRVDVLEVVPERDLWQGLVTWTAMNDALRAQSAGVLETHQSQHTAVRDLVALRAVYATVYGTGESTTNILDITTSAAFISGATKREAAFGGARTLTMRPRRFAVTDLVSIVASKGGVVSVASFANTAGGGWPTNRSTLAGNAGEGNNRGAAAPDLTHEADAAPAAATSTGWGPVAIIGTPKVPSPYAVIGIGDSIMAGEDWLTAALFKITANLGLFAGLTIGDGAVPFVNLGIVATTAQAFAAATSSEFRREACRHGTHVVIDLMVNDINSGRSLSALAADLQACWDAAAAPGVEVIAVTGTPITTSTDSWTTTVNQTVASGYNINTLNALNAWIRTLPPPVSKVIDKAAALMSGNVWAAPGGVAQTADGTHLVSTTGAVTAAATVPVTTWFPYVAPTTRTIPDPAALTSLPSLTTGGAAYWEEYNAALLAGANGAAVATLPGLRNGRDLTQATGAKQPTILTPAAAFRKMLRFDRAAGQFLKSAAIALASPFTFFIVVRRVLSHTGGTETLLSGVPDGNVRFDYTNATTLRAGLGGTLPAVTLGDSLIHVVTGIFDGASTELRRDGANTVTGTVSAFSPGGVTLGALFDGTQPASIDFGQLVVCSGHLNATDRAAIEVVLKANWETP